MLLRLQEKQNNEPVYVVQGNAAHLPYVDHTFDTALGVHILHLIPNWQDVITELIRVLKPHAPFIQCYSKSDDAFKNLWAAWRSAVPDQEAKEVGLASDINDVTLQSLGWRVGEAQTFDYSYGRSPALFIQQLENRVWSRTWRLSDESLAAGVAAVKVVVAQEYADPEANLTIHERFFAIPYYPPK